MELNGWAIGTLGHPQEKVSLFTLLEVHQVVARAFETKFRDDLHDVLSLNLRFLLDVGDHAGDVLNQMSEPTSDTS
jgi:hypothetical protein